MDLHLHIRTKILSACKIFLYSYASINYGMGYCLFMFFHVLLKNIYTYFCGVYIYFYIGVAGGFLVWGAANNFINNNIIIKITLIVR